MEMDNSLKAIVGDYEVTVQVLRVNSKKMTMQFFRQVPREQYFVKDAESDVSLTPWGRVNYRIPNEGNEWLLAERDGKLFRCCIDLPNTNPWGIDHHTKGIAESREKLAEYAGKPHLQALSDIHKNSLTRHTEELRKTTQLLDLAQRQAAVLRALEALPQIYIA